MTTEAAYTKRNIRVSSGFSGGYTTGRVQSILAGYDGSSIYATDLGYSYDGTGYSLILSTNDDTTGNPIERMRINSSGSIGIGTTSPTRKLHVNGDIGLGFGLSERIYSDAAYIELYNASTGDMTLFNGYVTGATRFFTNNTERMRILANGNVLIANTTYTADRLSVEGAANNWTGKFVGSTTTGQSFGIDIVAGTNGADYPLYVRTTNFSLRLYVRGDGVCYIGASSWVYNSDRRVKENISDVVNGLDLVSKLKPKHFDYINGAKDNLGFIAQEVQELIPQAVTISDEKTGMLGLKTDFIIPYLVKSIQELSAKNTLLEERLTALENN